MLLYHFSFSFFDKSAKLFPINPFDDFKDIELRTQIPAKLP